MKWWCGGAQELKGCGLKTSLCRLSLGAVVYNHWKHRNDIKHGNTPLSEDRIIQKIKWEICTRILSKGRFKLTKQNMEICHNWNLQLKILGEVRCF
jgi:hypothetical protein